MNRIIVHDNHTGNPIYIRINAIDVVRKGDYDVYEKDGGGDYSQILVGEFRFSVRENFATVMMKIQEAESEDKT